MTQISTTEWESKRTDETRQIEEKLRTHFERVDAYRYNPASIRVRVVDPRFEGLSRDDRDKLVEPYLETLPERTQADVTTLLTFSPSELGDTTKAIRASLLNTEFDHPSESVL